MLRDYFRGLFLGFQESVILKREYLRCLHSQPSPSSVCSSISPRTSLKSQIVALGRLLPKETTYILHQYPTTIGPFLPHPTLFFNIQIGCFVLLNWRLIAHIWWCLFRKTMAFSFHYMLVIKFRDQALQTTPHFFLYKTQRGRLDCTLTSSEAGGSHGDQPSKYLFNCAYMSSTYRSHMNKQQQ